MTPEGVNWVQAHSQPLTENEVNHLAFDFMNVKLKQQPDAVDLELRPAIPNQEEQAKSSPDIRNCAESVSNYTDKLQAGCLNGVSTNPLLHC